MKVQLKENLVFINKNDETDKIKIIKWHYYCQDEEIWCARSETEIYPLSEIYLADYCPVIEGVIVKEYELYE